MDAIYREFILDHYHHPRNFGRMKKPTISMELFNSFCGDKIGFDLKFSSSHSSKGRNVSDVKFFGSGCAISIASASILSDYIKKLPIDKIMSINTKELIKLLNIQLSPTRLKCALLPLEVLHKACSLLK